MLTKAQDDELVMGLVELAMARPSAEREAYIRNACDGDSELVAKVRNYVHWEETMDRFLLDPIYRLAALKGATDAPTKTTTAWLGPIESRTAIPQPSEQRFEPGTQLLGRFRIVRLLAEGSMGVVYEAWDEKLERRIAIKCAKSGFHKRLPPEVRHAREIRHSNVCKIFEIHTASTARGEVDFFTMEFLDGETLADRLRRGLIPAPEATSMARQICAGLAEAHRQGVVHGDLKSRNVIVARNAQDATERPVITDFGLAHGPGASPRGGNLDSAQAGGTPDSMAPELWKGAKHSCASDVYALGVILHELEFGRRLGREASPRERSKRRLPRQWDSVTTRCLDPNPDRRFQSAVAVAEALAPPRPLPWPLMAAAALLAIIVGIVTYRVVTEPKESWRLAMLPIQSSSAETAALAADLSRDTAIQLGRLKGGNAARFAFVHPDGTRPAQGATHILKATLAKQNGNLLLHATITDARSGANLTDWTGDYTQEETRRDAPVALAGLTTGVLSLPPLTVAAVNAAAARDYWAGIWYTRQNSTLGDALRMLTQAAARDSGSPLTYAALAEAQWFEYYLTKDPQWLDRTRYSVRQAEARNPDVAAAHRVEGYLYYADGLYQKAVPEFERAIELQPGNAMAHIYLGKAYEDNYQLDRALTEFQRAADVEPGYFRTYQNLGAYYLHRSDFGKGAVYHQKAVDLAPNEPNLHSNLAAAYMGLGKFPEAERQLLDSVRLQETPTADYDLGQIQMYEGKDEDAVQSFQRALSVPLPLGGSPKYLILMYLGIAHRRLNHSDEARRVDLEGLKMAEDELHRNFHNGFVKAFLGYFNAALGNRRDVENYIADAVNLFPDDWATTWTAVATYEELYRESREHAFRDGTLRILSHCSPSEIEDFNRWPDFANLKEDPSFKSVLASQRGR